MTGKTPNNTANPRRHGTCYIAAHTIKVQRGEDGGMFIEVTRVALTESEGKTRECELLVRKEGDRLTDCRATPCVAQWDWGSAAVDVCRLHDQQLRGESQMQVRADDRS